MRCHEYQKLALRTLPKKESCTLDFRQIQLVHAMFGISGEIGEVIQDLENRSNVIQEVGDILWYVAIALDALDFDMENLEYEVDHSHTYDDLTIQTSIAVDIVKRHIFYKAEFNFEKFYTAIGGIMSALHGIAEEYRFNLQTAMDLNIQKLKKRYPDKFLESLALQRDVAKESKVFDDVEHTDTASS